MVTLAIGLTLLSSTIREGNPLAIGFETLLLPCFNYQRKKPLGYFPWV